jgi:ribosomal protein S18 acetylase RimI-like enzyme
MEIQIVTADHAAQWSRLRLEALERDPEAFSSSVEEHKKLTLDEIRKRLGSVSGDSFVLGAFENERLIGTAGFYREQGPKTRHKGHIWGVYVTPGSRGQGCGRRLLEALVQRARTIEGVEQIQLSVASTQTAAAKLYRSLGFVSFGIEPRALKVAGRYLNEEYMALDLKD